jgi:glucose-fructose oxidoreductase
MARIYRLGVVGFAHMHINTLMDQFRALPAVQWVACADTVPDVPELVEVKHSRAWNLRYACETIGIPRVYPDYREMLAAERCDLVLCCPENARHAEVTEAVASSGAHVLTEKPMATSLPEALRMMRAARRHGVELFVNWPNTWSPAVRMAKTLLDRGAVGTLWQVKVRRGSLGPWAHGSTRPGPDGRPVEMSETEKGATWWYRPGTGGGALLDYCCYGTCQSRWFVGEPATAVFGLAANLGSPYGGVEDNVAMLVRFPTTMGILEASWTSVDHGVPAGPLIYGSTGTIVVDGQAPQHSLWIARGRDRAIEPVEPDPFPGGRDTVAKEVLHHLETGEAVHRTLDAAFNLEVMGILDAGIRSARSGRLEPVDDARWGLSW